MVLADGSSGWGVAWRAVLAVSLLAGFYVVALVTAGTMFWFAVWSTDSYGDIRLVGYGTLFTDLVIVALGMACWVSLQRRALPPAVALDVSEAPELWALVCDLAGRVDCTPPDSIRLVAEANAGVVEDTSFWGLRPGQRCLDIGFPLLMRLNVDQLKAVLAHELGHYSRQDTRLSDVVYRGRETIMDVVERLGPTPWGALLRGYFWLYWSISSAVLRRQERLADRCAVSVTDGPTLGGALRELNAVKAAWRTYLDVYVGLDRSGEYAPDNICGDFSAFLETGIVDLTTLRRELPDHRTRWDTHPPLAERVAMLERLAMTMPADENTPAVRLVPNLCEYGPRLDRVAFPIDARIRLPFAYFAVSVTHAAWQRAAVALYRAAASVDATATGLTGVLDLLAAGQAERLAAEVARAGAAQADPSAAVPTLVAHVEAALALAAVSRGAARWRHSFRKGAELIDNHGRLFPSGDPLGLTRVAGAACLGSPAGVTDIRARLAGHGLNESAGVLPNIAPPTELLAAMTNVAANDRPFDLLIFTTGLLLVPVRWYSSGILAMRWLTYLVEHITTTRDLPEYGWHLPYTDIDSARLTHHRRADVLLTLRDNTFVRIEENRYGTEKLATGHDNPRKLLRTIAQRIGMSESAPQPRHSTPAVHPTRAPADAHRELAGAGRRLGAKVLMFGALAFSFNGIILLVAGASEASYVFFGVAALVLLIAWRGLPSDPEPFVRAVLYIILGGAVAFWVIFFGISEALLGSVIAIPPMAFGALLIGLGLARLRGRWPQRTGNGWKVAAAAASTVGFMAAIGRLQGSSPDLIGVSYGLWGLVVLLFVIGAVRAVRPVSAADAVPWYALHRNKASLYGVLALATTVAVPIGMVFGVLSIRAARRVGARPPLTGVLAVLLPPLLAIVALGAITVPW